MDDEGQFGRRVRYWRIRRGLTPADFAALMNKSMRWVEDLEGGRRQADPHLSVLKLIALRLDVPLDRLLEERPAPRAETSAAAAVHAVLRQHDAITGTCDGPPAAPPTVTALRRALVHARSAFQAGHFAQLGTAIPVLLTDAALAAGQHRGADRLEAYRLLSLSLELTEAAAIKWGDTKLAVVAGHRAVAAAEVSCDPVIMASAARHLGDAMTAAGQAEAAAVFITASAVRLHDELLKRGPDGLSVLGMLHLKAAMAQAAAAEADDRTGTAAVRDVHDHLDQAAEHADRLGGDSNLLWTSFGPTNVGFYRVAAHVQLGQGSDAVAAAAAIPAEARARLPRERQAHLLTDLAHGQTAAGLRRAAVTTLLDAEALAPQEVRDRPRTRQLVDNLRRLGTGSDPTEGRLRALAGRCGLPR